ncbi:hypothetical protein ACFQ1S_11115, partial [Kibdelosporangium lantanae]
MSDDPGPGGQPRTQHREPDSDQDAFPVVRTPSPQLPSVRPPDLPSPAAPPTPPMRTPPRNPLPGGPPR